MAGGLENPWKYQVSKGFCFLYAYETHQRIQKTLWHRQTDRVGRAQARLAHIG